MIHPHDILEQETYELKVPQWAEPIYTKPYTYVISYGGRGGGKTYTIAEYMIVSSFQDYNCNYLFAREVQDTLDNSVFSVVEEKIEELGVSDYFTFKKNSFYNNETNVQFLFKGLWRRPNSIKGLPRLKKIWIDEASDISIKSWKVLIPTMTRNKGCQMICTLNPYLKTDIVYHEFVENKLRENAYVVKVSYFDNPYVLPPEFYEEAERMKQRDTEEYNHIYLGECISNSSARVFRQHRYWQISDEFVENDYEHLRFGLDFGFSRDPLFGVRLFIRDRCIYVTHEAVALELDVDKTAGFLIQNLPDIEHQKIYCDSAAPAYIYALRKVGLNAEGVQKGRGSIEDGIRFLKAHDMIYIHPRCTHLIQNFSNYMYKTDRGGDITRELEDKNNDGIDAMRYAVENIMKSTYNNDYKTWNIGSNENSYRKTF